MFQSALLDLWRVDRQIQQGLSYEGPWFETTELAQQDSQLQDRNHPLKPGSQALRLRVVLVRNQDMDRLPVDAWHGAVFEPGHTGRTALMSKESHTQLSQWIIES